MAQHPRTKEKGHHPDIGDDGPDRGRPASGKRERQLYNLVTKNKHLAFSKHIPHQELWYKSSPL